ncbi:MAG: UbiA family prenyltransferase [Marmoricola sp.]|nr:UbiA family prenyltransferase [Marmoricola sp.]
MTTPTRSAGPTEPKTRRQLPALVRASHPRQALAFAVATGVLVGLSTSETTGGRIAGAVLVAAAAVLVAQLIMGLVNDLLDVDLDRAAGVDDKPIAAGVLPSGNASFAVAVLLLLVIPLALQNGTSAGLFLLATLAVGYVHNRWLHRTMLSWVGWAATFALLSWFVCLSGFDRGAGGSAPLTWFTVLCAVLGVCVHFLTSLPDLVRDNTARVRHLPLRVALHTGATKLLVISSVLTLAVLATLVVQIISVGAIRE